MNEFGRVVTVDHVLAVSKEHRTAIALAAVVAYPDRLGLDLQFLRGHRHDGRFWSAATDREDPSAIRMACTSSADVVPELTPILHGSAVGADLRFAAGGVVGSGGGWEDNSGAVTDGFGGRWTVWPYPRTGILVVWWSWFAGGIEPGSAEFELPNSPTNHSIWD